MDGAFIVVGRWPYGATPNQIRVEAALAPVRVFTLRPNPGRQMAPEGAKHGIFRVGTFKAAMGLRQRLEDHGRLSCCHEAVSHRPAAEFDDYDC